MLNNENFSAAMQRAAGIGAWERNLETGEVRWSDGQYAIFGMDPGSILPNDSFFIDSVHPEDRKKINAFYHRVLSQGIVVGEEFRIVRADGAVRYLSVVGEIAGYDAEGRPLRLTGLCQDPSRPATLAALEARDRRGITVIDLDYRPMFWKSRQIAGEYARKALELATVAVGNLDECETAVGVREPDAAAQSSSPGWAWMTSSACVPIEPVAPRSATRFTRRSVRTATLCDRSPALVSAAT